MREDHRELIEVHVAGICFRESEGRVSALIAKRAMGRSLYPGLWECGGGQVNAGENFDEAVIRQIREEFGIVVDRALPFKTYEIAVPDLSQKRIPGIVFVSFLCECKGDVPEPVIDCREHSECRWQAIDELSEFDFIPGLRDDIQEGWDFYSLLRI
jgi:8-oxo-dGTP pyrophosphatase MutT (NUDIX family)